VCVHVLSAIFGVLLPCVLILMASVFGSQRCPHHSIVWMLHLFDASIGQTYLTTAGVVGNPAEHTILNWFKIQKYEDAYKLVYIVLVCAPLATICARILECLWIPIGECMWLSVMIPSKLSSKNPEIKALSNDGKIK